MARLSSCKGCNKLLQPFEKYKHGTKIYCKSCNDKLERTANEYKELMTYICDNFEIKCPTGLILKQVKRYKDENNWGYGAIHYTLWYCKEILGLQFNEKFGIYMVQDNYFKARDFFTEQQSLKNQADKLKDKEEKVKSVKLQTNRNNNIKHNRNRNSLIDISDLLN